MPPINPASWLLDQGDTPLADMTQNPGVRRTKATWALCALPHTDILTFWESPRLTLKSCVLREEQARVADG